MHKTITAAGAALLMAITSPALAAPSEYTTTQADQQKIAVTIYNQDLALVKDQRTISLPTGTNTLAFREISAHIKPQTALLSGSGLTLYEQNFEFDLLTPQALLEKYVGYEVTVVKTHPTTGEETFEKGTVLSANNGVVLKLGDHIETGIPGRLIFADVPDNLRDSPTLTMLVNSTTARPQNVELSYLTTGLGWQADYVAELAPTDSAMDINGWVTLTNRSGATYTNAHLQLVAGDVHQVPPEGAGMRRLQKDVMTMAARETSMAEEQMFEYHLYTLGRPTTIRDNQSKQVALMQAEQIPCRKEFLLQGRDYYYRGEYDDIGRKMKVAVLVEVENSQNNNLGVPLPKGVVRVYKKDSQDRLQFVGEDRIDHTPENETLRLKLGDAFDITAHKKQVNFKKVAGFSRYHYVYEGTYQIEVKNGKKEDISVKVAEPIPGDWEMLEESLPHEKEASNWAVWQVPVPPLGHTVLTYRVRVKY